MFAVQSISNKLLADWKSQTGEIGQMLPKYLPEPPQQSIPAAVEMPEFKICEVDQDGNLVVPQAVKTQYAACPIRAGEWRKILSDFDRKWKPGNPSAPPSAAPGNAASDAVVPTAHSENQSGDRPCPNPDLDWQSIFSGEPTCRSDFEQKYQVACSFAVMNEVTGIITDGPKLFLMATADAELDGSAPILCCGAGMWLLDGKATAFDEERGDTPNVNVPMVPPIVLFHAFSVIAVLKANVTHTQMGCIIIHIIQELHCRLQTKSDTPPGARGTRVFFQAGERPGASRTGGPMF